MATYRLTIRYIPARPKPPVFPACVRNELLLWIPGFLRRAGVSPVDDSLLVHPYGFEVLVVFPAAVRSPSLETFDDLIFLIHAHLKAQIAWSVRRRLPWVWVRRRSTQMLYKIA